MKRSGTLSGDAERSMNAGVYVHSYAGLNPLQGSGGC